jgi:hypothetical protein
MSGNKWRAVKNGPEPMKKTILLLTAVASLATASESFSATLYVTKDTYGCIDAAALIRSSVAEFSW